jgi:hypothetical protein
MSEEMSCGFLRMTMVQYALNTASGTRVPVRPYVYVTLTLESFYSAVTRRHPGSNLTRAKRNLGVTLPRPGPSLAHLYVYRR